MITYSLKLLFKIRLHQQLWLHLLYQRASLRMWWRLGVTVQRATIRLWRRRDWHGHWYTVEACLPAVSVTVWRSPSRISIQQQELPIHCPVVTWVLLLIVLFNCRPYLYFFDACG